MTESTGKRQRSREHELRLHGLNACLAAFTKRPQDLRKVYLSEARMAALRDVLAHCVRNRLGYRVVDEDDLHRLTGSAHHEGVCFEYRRPPVPALSELLVRQRSQARALLIWLDGVGNPHNFGAVLRSAAHFGVCAILLPPGSGLALSGSACRVAEGGAEAVPLIRLHDSADALRQLRESSFRLAATVVRDGRSLFATRPAQRLVLVFGAEQTGLSRSIIDACDERWQIPGTGAVESLNIAAAAAVFMAAWAQTASAVQPTQRP